MDNYCNENGFIGWFETSAKDNLGIEEAARALVQAVLDNDPHPPSQNANNDGVIKNLADNDQNNEQPQGDCKC